jgi:DNA-directed RNA polymerase subunit RPC12/RpoP
MTSSCPDCGEEVEFAEREVHLRTGTCAACGHEFTLVAGAQMTVPEATGAPRGPEAEAATPRPEGGPECADCGRPLRFEAHPDGSLEARCDECETSAMFVPQSEERPAPSERAERRFSRGPPGETRSRPCRQCGAPLRFSTNEEGLLVGECESCGNRFTLPPRAGGGRGAPPFSSGRPGGGRYGPPRGRGPWRGGPPAGGRRRRFEAPSGGSDERYDRKRRRTRE